MDPAFSEVLDRCRAGERDAFEQVIARYGLQVLRTVRLIVRDEELAEDVCREAFVKAWRSLRTLGKEEPGPWLTRIATNESISACRRRHRFDPLAQRGGLVGIPRQAISTETTRDVGRALEGLSPEQRAAVVLHYYQGLSVEETARALSAPVDTMKSRMKAALQRLRELTGIEEVANE